MLVALLCTYFTVAQLHAQSPTTSNQLETVTIPDNTFTALQKKYNNLSENLSRQSNLLLKRMEKRERKIRARMHDTTTQWQEGYHDLTGQLNDTAATQRKFPLKEYVPSIDTMQSSLRFLQQAASLPGSALNGTKVTSASNSLLNLQGKLQHSSNINDFLVKRRDELKDQLLKLGMTKDLITINKEAYYYKQRITQAKDAIKDQQKMEQAALSAIKTLPAFKNFMAKNSYLAQLFGTPANLGTMQALAGLQTRSQVQALMAQNLAIQLPPSGPVGAQSPIAGNGPEAMIQQQVDQAQGQIDKLKNQATSFANKKIGANADPTDFTPNQEKTKSFLKRIEFGFNIQSTGSSKLLPSMTEFGLSLGYKLTDKITLGTGASYKQGWGTLFNHIRLTGEGIGIRSFVDVKAKGSIWLTGGYELNYMQSFRDLARVISNIDVWQKSGLAGLTKKVQLGKKEAKFQLLWDFLSYSQKPEAAHFKTRIAYNF